MKIVLKQKNCFLPRKTIEKYFELSGFGKPFFYLYTGSTKKNFHYRILNENENIESFDVSKKYIGDTTTYDVLYIEKNFFDLSKIKREDKNYIQSIEETKPKYFKVIEIPDDTKYRVKEYRNGREYLEEISKIWK